MLIKGDLDDFSKKIGKLTQAPSSEDFQLLRGRLDQSENQVGSVRKSLFDLEKKMKQLKASQGGPSQTDPAL